MSRAKQTTGTNATDDIFAKNREGEYVICRGGKKNCNKVVLDEGDGLMCECCNTWFHPECQGIALDTYKIINDLGPDVTWYCLVCKNIVKKIVDSVGNVNKRCNNLKDDITGVDKKVETLRIETDETKYETNDKIKNVADDVANNIVNTNNQISDLKIVVENLKSEVDSLKNTAVASSAGNANGQNSISNATRDTIVKEVATEFNSIKFREKNVVIYNLKESVDASVDVRRDDDLKELTDIGTKMSYNVSRNTIRKVSRIGKQRTEPNSKPRPTLVSFYSVESKSDFLSKLRNLKGKNVAITVTHDMTPEERKSSRELVEEAKRLTANSDEYTFFVRGPPGAMKVLKRTK